MPERQQLELGLNFVNDVNGVNDDIKEKDFSNIDLDSFGMLSKLITAGKDIPAWWTPNRDAFLREFVVRNAFMSSAISTLVYILNSIDFIVTAKNSGVAEHLKVAQFYNEILQQFLSSAEFEQFNIDVLTQDNGGWLFVTSPEMPESPIQTFATGLKHLDSAKVQRTGDSTYPIIYRNDYNDIFKIHHTRVINMTQMPLPFEDTYGIGLSFVSRSILFARHLSDIETFEAELLGSRSASEIVLVTGANSRALKTAVQESDIESDNSGMTRYGKRVWIGIRDASAKLQRVLLKSLPDGYDKKVDFSIVMGLLAFAAGVAVEHFSLDGTISGSRAGLNLSDNFSSSKLQKWYIDRVTSEITNKFLPDSLKLEDEQSASRLNSEKSKILRDLAYSQRTRIEYGITTPRVERESLVDQGVISYEQFAEMELSDGRLPNGLPVSDIIYSSDAQYKKYIDQLPKPIGVDFVSEESLAKIIEVKNQAALQAMNSKSGGLQQAAKIMYHALNEIEEQYRIVLNKTSTLLHQQTQQITDANNINEDGELINA